MVSDRRYIDARVADLLTYVRGMRTADAEALHQARQSLAVRLDGMNEFRQALTEQAATFTPRNESEGMWQRNTERLDGIAAEHATFLRRPEHDALTERVNALDARLTRAEGADSGIQYRTADIRQTVIVSAAVLGVAVTALIAFFDHFIR